MGPMNRNRRAARFVSVALQHDSPDSPVKERPLIDKFVAQEHHLPAFSGSGTRFVATLVATQNPMRSNLNRGRQLVKRDVNHLRA
jgi:hypothetical protein